MPEILENQTVGTIVSQWPQLADVLEELQIDYCCGGNQPLEQACAARGLDAAEVLQKLRGCGQDAPSQSAESHWLEETLTRLCDHIQQTHHVYLQEELPRLTERLGKVVATHGKNHPELAEVQRVFTGLREELEAHLAKEERILFPAIRRLENSRQAQYFPFGSLANPIHCMENEHDSAGKALGRLRRLNNDYQAPPDACNTYVAALDGLRRLEVDLHRHIHKENNILFPRAVALEKARTGS